MLHNWRTSYRMPVPASLELQSLFQLLLHNVLDVPKLAVILSPLIIIVPMVVWFSTRVQRKYRKQRESTGG
ncbi:MAG: hypothetical protein Ct9H90mP26_1840 [Methanobacteriota archaeon]|nr:MAG: hypothetical protein Ct9H90mP26_1840 [Euryarchaeota archaeon]